MVFFIFVRFVISPQEIQSTTTQSKAGYHTLEDIFHQLKQLYNGIINNNMCKITIKAKNSITCSSKSRKSVDTHRMHDYFNLITLVRHYELVR